MNPTRCRAIHSTQQCKHSRNARTIHSEANTIKFQKNSKAVQCMVKTLRKCPPYERTVKATQRGAHPASARTFGEAKRGCQEDGGNLANVARNQITNERLRVVVDGAAFLNCCHDRCEVVVGKDHVRRLLRNLQHTIAMQSKVNSTAGAFHHQRMCMR
jgi:hypothetical protein